MPERSAGEDPAVDVLTEGAFNRSLPKHVR
jgi:hypothetical protein